MKTIILASGHPPSKTLLEKALQESALLIAVDGGANCLFSYNIIPDYIVGDLDSIEPEVLSYFQNKKVSIEQIPCDKNYSDTAFALNKALSLGASDIIFLGCLRGRLDHTWCNIGLLKTCLLSNVSTCLKDKKQELTMINKSITLNGKKRTLFSVHTYNGTVHKLNITGAKYELNNYDLQVGESLTLSNKFLNQPVHIKFSSGFLLVVQQY